MSYIPNIQGLRFVERDGKKILQQWVYKYNGTGQIIGDLPYSWEDVPIEEEKPC